MALKMYIASAYTLISRETKGVVTFNYSFKDIENYPLERLLNIFQKLNPNTELHKRLNRLRESRNKIAHKSLLFVHDIFRELLGEDLEENHELLETLYPEVLSCLAEVQNETEVLLLKINNGQYPETEN